MEKVALINKIVSTAFFLCYFYQFAYIAVVFVKKHRKYEAKRLCRYAVLISARNEREVIGNLIDSIKAQKYPSELVTVFVVADNCTDDTAEIAERAGAVVYRRFDNMLVGKGYALDFLCGKIRDDYPANAFDGFFVFDADNVLDENYIAEMNKVFSNGHEIITSKRNSKNFGDNWISAGYALWFLRESVFLNGARMLLGTSCAVSGTGFVFSRRIFDEHGGWNFFLLTEDIEFSVASITNGDRIAYCPTAILYDEQPVSFRQSWRQRKRWARGYFQVFGKLGGKLVSGAAKGSFSCFDMTMTIMPAIVISFVTTAINVAAAIHAALHGGELGTISTIFIKMALGGYLTLFVVGAITTVTQWRNIYTTAFKKILYTFTFPLFMFTYLPISVSAIFGRVQWKPIVHSRGATVADITGGQTAA